MKAAGAASTAAPAAVAAPRPAAPVHLERLSVRDFRNLAREDLLLPAAGAVIVGENGHGKTNLLEAIYYLQLLRSARGARDSELVRFGADGFHLAATGDFPQAREVRVGFARQGARKKVTHDGVAPPRLSDGLGGVPGVLLSPRDVSLVAGSPRERRRFLDIALALSSPSYLHALQGYRGALARRNAALRSGGRRAGAEAAVAAWEPSLAAHGAALWAERLAWVATHAGEFTRLCAAIGERGSAVLGYTSRHAVREGGTAVLAAALESQRSHDLRRGLTHAGPHRDDLSLSLDGRELRLYGSAGQQRTASLALRLLEWATLRDAIGRVPLLLLDDPFAELDARRAERVLALLGEGGIGQAVLAVPREGDIPPDFTRLERFRVRDGAIEGAS